ncbi:hypothetical protein H2201_005800 [Coniosporium apollinis]|uniref:Sox C-terminal domain-containing protein n=1 Tax=Coniosporium apollinis TaxID=61459 RepID=A0ABQ9NNW3_9PEZI|nr:hypothetical protein H2201_005800 [Coniosporium apollinis]
MTCTVVRLPKTCIVVSRRTWHIHSISLRLVRGPPLPVVTVGDGRSAECLFTPVSAQAQAFVPAQTAWRNGQTPPLYGAYGQPLPPQHHQDPYAPRQPGYALPSPSGPYPAPGSAYAPGPYDDRSSHDATSRKRPANEPHTPTLPPPNPATASQLSGHRGSGAESSPYTYPDPTALTPAAVSPASSNASYHSSVPPHSQPQQPYYAPQPAAPRRSSPQSTYSYDPGRASSSPNTQAAPTTPGQAGYAYGGVGPDGLRPPQGGPAGHNDGRTPPPTSQGGSRPGMRITDIVDGGSGGGRSAADSDMLKALNRRPM